MSLFDMPLMQHVTDVPLSFGLPTATAVFIAAHIPAQSYCRIALFPPSSVGDFKPDRQTSGASVAASATAQARPSWTLNVVLISPMLDMHANNLPGWELEAW